MSVIIVTGGHGLVGSALGKLYANDINNTIHLVGREDADLVDYQSVLSLFNRIKPDKVIHTAARVGGIKLNLNSPGKQFYDNIKINTNVIEACRNFNITNLVAFGTACSFPADTITFKEEDLHKGEPFPAHRSYAYAKRMVDIQIEAYRKEYGLKGYCSIIPGNIFGPNDNFNLENGHVVPSLIRKCYEAKLAKETFKVWGSGRAIREFVYSEDLAVACMKLVNMDTPPQKVLMTGEPFKIEEIVKMICNAFDYNEIEWDTSKPEGQLARYSDKYLFNTIFPNFSYSNLEESITKTCKWFTGNYDNIRK